MKPGSKILPTILFGVALPLTAGHAAETALVAVAANFSDAMAQLEPAFEAESGHALTVTTGSTGKLYAQIVHGAPFDVLLAADRARPAKLEAEGHAVAGSRFTYAVGRLVLWSPDPARVAPGGIVALEEGAFRALAIANPDLAPYGQAARETLAALGLEDALRNRIVMGENVGQAFALVATGNAELGFVALSSLRHARTNRAGSRWDVPADLHAPIRQDAVLLVRARENPTARAFLKFLRSDAARATIARLGYGANE